MADYVDYWDETEGVQKRRQCTPEEQAELRTRRLNANVPVVPTSVSRKAARLALAHEGLFHMIKPTIAAMPEPQRTLVQIEWDDSLSFERTNATVIALGKALGMNDELLDALFVTAATLE